MPELPDIEAYCHALDTRLTGHRLEQVVLRSPFLLRSVAPPLSDVHGRDVLGFRRMGKRIVWDLEGDLHLVFHLMIAGRYHWRDPGAAPKRKTDLAAFRFDAGTVLLTEAGTKKRASLHVVEGKEGVSAHDPGGCEVAGLTAEAFREAVLRENHTLKRTLTDPRIFSGIGNAYSDEILHAARLSPVKWTSRLTSDELDRLYEAATTTLAAWMRKLVDESRDAFPEKVTAFRKDMAAHGRFGKPCPTCRTPIQRIVYAENETNYCPRCQTGGKVLADRSLSRLLGKDWPRSIEELEIRPGFEKARGANPSPHPMPEA